MKLQNSRCLILNADYTPLGLISWKRAMLWSMQYDHRSPMSITIISFYKNDFIIGTGNKKYLIPAVVKTNRYFKLNYKPVRFSRKNLFTRDNFTCQYCHNQKDINHLTYDHVIPKSLWNSKYGNPTSWTNIVTACVSCNRKKANKTLKQADMSLDIFPSAPSKSHRSFYISEYLSHSGQSVPEEWNIYVESY